MSMHSSETFIKIARMSAVTKYSVKKSDIHLVSVGTRDRYNECWKDKWWLVGFHYGRLVSMCPKICWLRTLIIEEIEDDTKDDLKLKTFLLLTQQLEADFYFFLHSGKRWKMNWGVAPLNLNFVSRFPSGKISPIISSSTFMFHKWRAPNHIFSDNCVFCLPMVLTPLMTINAECAFYSTF